MNLWYETLGLYHVRVMELLLISQKWVEARQQQPKRQIRWWFCNSLSRIFTLRFLILDHCIVKNFVLTVVKIHKLHLHKLEPMWELSEYENYDEEHYMKISAPSIDFNFRRSHIHHNYWYYFGLNLPNGSWYTTSWDVNVRGKLSWKIKI